MRRWLAGGVLLASLLGVSEAAAADAPVLRRFALVMGSNDGGEARVRLRYATTDARAVGRVLTDLGGVAPFDLVVLDEPDRDTVLAAFADLEQRLDTARAEGGRTEVVVYYSGHSDVEGLLPGGDVLAWRDLRLAVGRLPADVRVTVLDACASGALLRTKGGVRRPPFLVDQARSVTGEAVLASSTADEASQESDAIGASFFTHHLVGGLRGAADADADGLVTLSEAYAYAFRETRESTAATLAGTQNPTYALDLEGQGDFVVTDLRLATSTVVLAEELDGRVAFRGSNGRLLVEVDKLPGEALTLSVPDDTYTVALQSRPSVFEAQVVVQPGTSVPLDAGDFQRRTDLVATRLRGGTGPGRTTYADVQVVGGLGVADRHTRVQGGAFHLLDGRVHSLHGAALGFGVTRAEAEVHGAQLALVGARAGGDLRGVQGGALFTAARGDVVGFQGSGLFNVAGGRLQGVQMTFGVNLVRGDSPEGTFGSQLAAVGNVAGGGRLGAQLSALFNVQRGNLTGAQLALGTNVVGGRLSGAQVGFLSNSVRGRLDGLQWGFFYNQARALHGAQLGFVNRSRLGSGVQLGFVNVAGTLKGVQVGLVNVAESVDGESIGLINAIRDGYHTVELWSDDLTPVGLGVKAGSDHVYSVFLAGVDPVSGVGVSFGAGIGGHATFFEDRAFLDTDVTYRTVELDPSATDNDLGLGGVVSLRMVAGADVAGPFGLFVGPAFRVVMPFRPDAMPAQSLMPGFGLGPRFTGHLGYQAGMRVRF